MHPSPCSPAWGGRGTVLSTFCHIAPRAPSPMGEHSHFFLSPEPWGPKNISSGGEPRPSPVPHPGQCAAVAAAAVSPSQSPLAALDISRDGRGLCQVTVAFWYLPVHGTRFAEGQVCASGVRTGLREPRVQEQQLQDPGWGAPKIKGRLVEAAEWRTF